ncbi:uncharacterized protein DUF262 [Actinokineospora spheciospongiae]|nr:uncharacterized protein DUF262 [Actinokineospora spheciospongiae]
MVQEAEINVNPRYQRQFRWNTSVQSTLIESLLLGLPIPAIFVATNKDGTWDVVDGLQRISTILRFHGVDVPHAGQNLQFSNNGLMLTDLVQLSGFNGVTYNDLPKPIQLMLDRRYLRVQVLSDKSDVDVRFELFRRLNAGAVELTAQEIRTAVFAGPFLYLIEELAESSNYLSLLKLKQINQHDGTAAEIVLKFFAYLDKMETFDGKVTRFLNEYMKSRMQDTNLAEDRALFNDVAAFVSEVVDGPFLRARVNVTPVNQLEAVLIGVGRLIRAGRKLKAPKSGWENDPELVEASTKGTNSRSMLMKRVGRVEEIFS